MPMLNSSQSKFFLSQSRCCPICPPEQGKMRQMTDTMSYIAASLQGQAGVPVAFFLCLRKVLQLYFHLEAV